MPYDTFFTNAYFFWIVLFVVFSILVYSCMSNVFKEKRMNAIIGNLRVLSGQREGHRFPSY